MKRFFRRFALLTVLLLSPHARAQFDDPFKVQARLDTQDDLPVVRLDVTVPPRHHLYADDLKVTDAVGTEQAAIELPTPGSVLDPNTGKPVPVYESSFKAVYAWKPAKEGAVAIHVHYWGCNDQVCFIPQTKVVELEKPTSDAPSGPVAETPAKEQGIAGWRTELSHFALAGSAAGYMRADAFLRFLDRAEKGEPEGSIGGFSLFLTDPVAFVRESGLLLTVLFILVGGLALNLTPCVLPMIPVNLAIIGAGARAGSRRRGFLLGGMYGLGIALAYGLLGLAVVLTGSRFGTIQANPWFNLAIALVFVLLALAMFDVVHIDFSRFQSRLGGAPQKQGSLLLAFTMGSVSALLAGACVAPVVIAVLALSTNIYEANRVAGLLLPFVLGLGMGLPWPFAGAGLSFLPRPGRWMEYVKYGFGVGIVLFALYYGHLSYRAFRPADLTEEGEVEGHVVVDGSTNAGLAEALAQARAAGKPVFIDFWASWCKNCVVMGKTTFKDEAVKARLSGYAFIKYVAEDYVDRETKAMMDYFGVQGLPTFVVLKPLSEDKTPNR